MKRLVILIVTLALLLGISATAFARDDRDDRNRHERDRRAHHNQRVQRDNEQRVHRDKEQRVHRDRRENHQRPFQWRDHHRTFNRHHMERIHDRDLEYRYPGLHGYRWRGHGEHHHGFWHNDRYVDDAILFFNSDGEVVSFGYMRDGLFIVVNEDGYHDDTGLFFLRFFIRL